MRVLNTKNAPDPHKIWETNERIRNRQLYPNWRCLGCGALLQLQECAYCGRINSYPKVKYGRQV